MESPYYTTTAPTVPANPALMAAIVIITISILMAIMIPTIIGLWKTFIKAGKPGWMSIIPFYNTYVLTVEIAQKPMWWFILLFVPYANIVINIMIALEIAKKFGKSTAFAVFGLILFPFVGWPILGFGSAQYKGSVSTPAPTAE